MSDDDGIAGFPFLRRRGPLALIGVSSGVPTAPFLATGWLGTVAARRPGGHAQRAQKRKPVPRGADPSPAGERGRPQHKRLLDAPVLLRIIAAHGADLVLHGHDHLHMLNWLDGPNGSRVPAVGVPSASAAPGTSKDAAAYNLYRIDGAPGAWRCEMISRGIAADGEVGRAEAVDAGGLAHIPSLPG